MTTATDPFVEEVSALLTNYSIVLLHMEGVKRTMDILSEYTREIVTSPEMVTKVTELLESQTAEMLKAVERLSK